MKRDSLFFRLFKELPDCFFELIGRPASDALHYKLDAIEFKQTSVRLDGVFYPNESAAGPVYIWEAQYYPSDTVYANVMSKVGRFLEHGDPAQDWVAVIIYPSRSMEQKNLRPYRCLLESDQVLRIYLDELPPAPADQFEMGVLELIAAKPDIALEKAQKMLPRLRASKKPKQFQRALVQLIETVIVYQFPKWSREEVEKMLQVSDVRQTRVFQEAREEGREEGREEVALRFVQAGHAIEEVAQVTGLSAAKIRKLLKPPAKTAKVKK